MNAIIAQTIGFVGTGMVIAGFQCKDTRKLMLIHAFAALLFAVHFFLLGGITGAFSQILYTVNIFLLSDRKHRWASWAGWRYMVSALLVFATVLSWKGPADLLPCIASVANTLANWSRNGKTVRLSRLFIASPCWIIYDVLVGSVSGIACEAFSMGSILVSIWRYGMAALDS